MKRFSAAMEEKTAEFREDVLAQTLLDRQQNALRQMLALAQIFDIPVPQEAIQAVAGQERVSMYSGARGGPRPHRIRHRPRDETDTAISSPRFLRLYSPTTSAMTSAKPPTLRGATVLHRLWVLEDHDAN